MRFWKFNMSYVGKTLSKDEKIEVKAKLHWVNYIPAMFFAAVTFFLAALMYADPEYEGHKMVFYGLINFFGIWTIYSFLKQYMTEMVVTNKRVVFKKGIVSIETYEIKTTKIESIAISQSVLGRILGYADIWFSGTGNARLKFCCVADPWDVRGRIEERT